MCDYHDGMDASDRRFVSRACMVCEWHGEAVERDVAPVECPWCHAPTRITRQEWLIPMLGNKNSHAAAAATLSRLGASRGGKARAARLSSSRRSEIARTAAQARWRRR